MPYHESDCDPTLSPHPQLASPKDPPLHAVEASVLELGAEVVAERLGKAVVVEDGGVEVAAQKLLLRRKPGSFLANVQPQRAGRGVAAGTGGL